jgi:EmrB/QacA subfamily drug resistance transporter
MTVTPNSSIDELGIRQAWRTLRWTSAALFMVLLDGTILFVAFPSIRRSFPSVLASDLSWILNAYTVVYAALLTPAGRMADRLGRRRVFLQGVGIFTLGSLACLMAPNPLFVIAGRIVQAVGGAMITPSSLALILAAFPRPKWPVAVSQWAAVGALAAAVGPSLGAAIVQLGGWRWAFLINLPIGIVVWSRSRMALAESQDPNSGEAPDAQGIALLIISVGLIALGIVKEPEWHALAVAWVISGLIFLSWFVSRSLRVPVPALDLILFSARNFRYANIATLVFGAAFSAMFLGGVLFLANVWGYDTAHAGLGMTPGPLLVIVVAPLAGRLAARIGHRVPLILGGIVFGAGFLLRWAVTSSTSHYLSQWLPVVITTGIGVGLLMPSLASAAVHGLPQHRLGVGSAVNQAIRQIGFVLGVSVTIAVVGSAHGPEALTAFQPMFLLLAVGGFVTALLSLPIDTQPAHTQPETSASRAGLQATADSSSSGAQ